MQRKRIFEIDHIDNLFSGDVIFTPDEELLKFATYFSEYYEKLDVGDYSSDNGNYNIRYMKRIINNGEVSNTGARVGLNSGIIEMDEFIFKNKEYSSDYIFFLILWFTVNRKYYSDVKLVDKISVEYYLKTLRSKDNLSNGWMKLFSPYKDDPLIVERTKAMLELLDKN